MSLSSFSIPFKQKQFAQTKDLLELDKVKLLTQLNQEYNEKVQRMIKLKQLREQREKLHEQQNIIEKKEEKEENEVVGVDKKKYDDWSEYTNIIYRKKKQILKEKEQERIEEEKKLNTLQFQTDKQSKKAVFENLLGLIKSYWFLITDYIIMFLHGRNLSVRLNMDHRKDIVEMEDKIEDDLKLVNMKDKEKNEYEEMRLLFDIEKKIATLQQENTNRSNNLINAITKHKQELDELIKEEILSADRVVDNNKSAIELKEEEEMIYNEAIERNKKKEKIISALKLLVYNENDIVYINYKNADEDEINETIRTVDDIPNQLEYTPVPKVKTYSHKSRVFMFFWGIYFYCMDQTEVFVQIIYFIDYLFNQSIVNMILPIFGFVVVMLLNRPHPSKNVWNFFICYLCIIIGLKLFFQLPGFCLRADDNSELVIGFTTELEGGNGIYCSSGISSC